MGRRSNRRLTDGRGSRRRRDVRGGCGRRSLRERGMKLVDAPWCHLRTVRTVFRLAGDVRPVSVFLTLALVACSPAAPAGPERQDVATTSEPTSESESFSDASADLVTLDGAPVDGLPYFDILEVDIAVAGDDLRAVMTLGGIPPIGVDGTVEPINFLVMLNDGDFWISMENRSDGQYHPALSDFSDSGPYTYDEGEYPGTGSIDGKRIVWTIPLSVLNDPTTVNFRAWTQKSDANFDVEAEDFLPDDERFATAY